METAPLPTSREKAGLQGLGYSMGAAAGDYDNDGFVDLYVAGVNRNQLFHNNCDGTFTDVTAKAGVAGTDLRTTERSGPLQPGGSTSNNDGLLDLFVVNYLDYDANAPHLSATSEAITIYCSPNDFSRDAKHPVSQQWR